MHFFRKHWPVLIIAAVVLFLSIVNYHPGMILIGGDNLHPEFNFPLNFRRMIFSVWEEYEGVGALAGMGHATDLVRTIFLWLLSFILPMELLRYVVTMLTLFLGSTGAYYLIRKLISHSRPDRESDTHFREDDKPATDLTTIVAFLGGLYYLLNLATLQQYYTPFEVFITHYAALPWLFLATINFFQHYSKKNLLLLSLVLFLSVGQGYVPTLFVVWLAATGVLTLFLFFQSHKPFANRAWLFAKYYLLIFLINAFWLLPFAYFTITSAHVDVGAKINQMASENIYSLNKEYGYISDVALLKGFWFNNVEPDFQGNITYMLLPWRDHMSNPLIPAIGYLFFAIILLGLIQAIRTKKHIPLALALIFFGSVLMLTTATPPFAQINDLIRIIIPLFKEVFRFPFTKFSTLVSLMYAIFFAYGIESIMQHKKLLLPYAISHKLYALLFSLLMVIFLLPAFEGHLLYAREKIALPDEYQQFFAYMQHQDPNGRVAQFPANSFWDWKFYQWGYSGSGFFWYGIPQPVLDRAFDMWGTHNENYYNELSQAVYSKNPHNVEQVFHKYDIRYLLFDTNVIYPPAPQALFYTELPRLLQAMPSVKKAATFGNLTVYNVTMPDQPKDFLSLSNSLPTVNDIVWNNNDVAYLTRGDYANPVGKQTPDSLYPFRSLFSGKTQSDKFYTMTEQEKTITLKATLPKMPSTTLTIPAFTEKETILPATLITHAMPNGDTRVDLAIPTPEIWYGTKKLTGGSFLQQLAILPKTIATQRIEMNINGITDVILRPNKATNQSIFLSLTQDNIIVLSDAKKKQLANLILKPTDLKRLPGLQRQAITVNATTASTLFKVIIPKVTDPYISYKPALKQINHIGDCDIFRKGDASAVVTTNNGLGQLQVEAKNATSCTSFYSPNLPHQEGYAIFITSQHKVGRGFHFWLVNEDEKFSAIDTYLPETTDATTVSSFVLPPQDKYGTSYSFHLDSVAIGNEETENILKSFTMYQIPYTYLTSLVLGETKPVSANRSGTTLTTSHPQETLYTVSLPQLTSQKTLILSQAFDNGWHVYAVPDEPNFLSLVLPFLTGQKVGDHMMIDGWANGWALSPQEANGNTLIIVYLPQYLEYLGFALLLVTGGYLAFIGAKRKI